MRWGPFLGLLILAGALQTSLLPALTPAAVRLDPLLLVALGAALLLPAGSALTAAWLAGLVRDGLSLNPPGCAALAFLVLAGLVLAWRDGLDLERPAGRLLVGAGGALAANLLILLLAGAAGQGLAGRGWLFRLASAAALNGLLFLFVPGLLRRLGLARPQPFGKGIAGGYG